MVQEGIDTEKLSFIRIRPSYSVKNFNCGDRDLDDFIYANDIASFVAAGNQTSSTGSFYVTTPGKALNAITVGGVYPFTNNYETFSRWKNSEIENQKPEIKNGRKSKGDHKNEEDNKDNRNDSKNHFSFGRSYLYNHIDGYGRNISVSGNRTVLHSCSKLHKLLFDQEDERGKRWISRK